MSETNIDYILKTIEDLLSDNIKIDNGYLKSLINNYYIEQTNDYYKIIAYFSVQYIKEHRKNIIKISTPITDLLDFIISNTIVEYSIYKKYNYKVIYDKNNRLENLKLEYFNYLISNMYKDYQKIEYIKNTIISLLEIKNNINDDCGIKERSKSLYQDFRYITSRNINTDIDKFKLWLKSRLFNAMVNLKEDISSYISRLIDIKEIYELKFYIYDLENATFYNIIPNDYKITFDNLLLVLDNYETIYKDIINKFKENNIEI